MHKCTLPLVMVVYHNIDYHSSNGLLTSFKTNYNSSQSCTLATNYQVSLWSTYGHAPHNAQLCTTLLYSYKCALMHVQIVFFVRCVCRSPLCKQSCTIVYTKFLSIFLMILIEALCPKTFKISVKKPYYIHFVPKHQTNIKIIDR